MSKNSDEDLGIAFARLQHSLRNYLRKRICDSTQVEDLLQDIFIKALVSKRAGRHFGNLTGWLFTTARTTLIDYYRATSKTVDALNENMPNLEVEDLQAHQEISACLMPFVRQLAPIYRDTLIATDFENQTMHAVAQKQKLSVSAIKSRTVRARAMLKQKLLVCCHVEMVDGLVSEYQGISPSSCCGKCK